MNNKKIVDIYGSLESNNIFIINNLDNGSNLWNESSKEFCLINISNIDWNKDLTPWKARSPFNEDFEGKAIEHLKFIENYLNSLNLSNKKIYLIGYSLAGLFSLYASFNSNMFNGIGCISASLWYPNLLDYVKENNINDNIEKIYISLGNKEKESKNKTLREIEAKTNEIVNNLKDKKRVKYELNNGGHFTDETIRILKCIEYLKSM